MNFNFKHLRNTFLIGGFALGLVACSSDDNTNNNGGSGETKLNDFQLAYANGSGNPSGTLIQGVTDLSTGVISFNGKGYKMRSTRTARIFPSADGSTIYSLNYTEGGVEKLTYQGGDNYTRIAEMASDVLLGTKTARFTKLSESEASLHYINATPKYDPADETKYLKHEMIASIGILDLNSMSFKSGVNKAIEITIDESLAKAGYFISRIDSPILSNGKLYYGAALAKFNAATGKKDLVDKACTLVVDYANLSKASVVFTTHVVGSTNGYRTSTQHKNEAGEILQMVEGNDQTYIVKMRDGKYDTSFVFELNKALSIGKSGSNGWFYAGNGIGYMPYEKLDQPQIQQGVDKDGKPTFTSAWGLARIDLNNNTAVNLEVPDNLWLFQYQNSVVRDGKFYIALAPISGKGNIYIFDVNSTSPKGQIGAEISAGADQYYIGIY